MPPTPDEAARDAVGALPLPRPPLDPCPRVFPCANDPCGDVVREPGLRLSSSISYRERFLRMLALSRLVLA